MIFQVVNVKMIAPIGLKRWILGEAMDVMFIFRFFVMYQEESETIAGAPVIIVGVII